MPILPESAPQVATSTRRRLVVSWLGAGFLAGAVGSVAALTVASRVDGPPSMRTHTSTDIAADSQETSQPVSPKSVQMSLPTEFEKRQADGGFLIAGFRVGFFEPSASEPFYTFTLTRREIRVVSPDTGEITLPELRHPGGRRAVVRVQALSAEGSSDWSEPSAPFDLASLPLAKPLTRAERVARPPRPPKRVTAVDIEPFPALKALLASQKPADMSEQEATAVFRNPRDLATALVISRDLSLPFTQLHAAIKADPRKRLVDIVKSLQPATNAARAIDAANRQARSLTNPRKTPVR